MGKYRVIVSYSGAIDVEVSARSEEEAEEKAEGICENMPNKEFIEKLEPQHTQTQTIEVDGKRI